MIEPVVIPWRRSSRCSSESACVEVLVEPGHVSLRSTQQRDRIVRFTADEWAAFAEGVRAGEFE